jgi:NOL1/NOP2/fmu family ribosome biogenesis protein
MCPHFVNQFSQKYDITDRDRLVKYMKGESIDVSGYRGYVAISYKGKTLGFAKGDGRQLKNRLPKGLRNTNVL